MSGRIRFPRGDRHLLEIKLRSLHQMRRVGLIGQNAHRRDNLIKSDDHDKNETHPNLWVQHKMNTDNIYMLFNSFIGF